MAKRMLIEATHSEETRVAIVDGNRLVDFDYEDASKQSIKGNVYLGTIIRVEPSLQAAFVDYGGNRHGFLAFSEIHPDYFRIPVEDRKVLEDLHRQVLMEEEGLETEADESAPKNKEEKTAKAATESDVEAIVEAAPAEEENADEEASAAEAENTAEEQNAEEQSAEAKNEGAEPVAEDAEVKDEEVATEAETESVEFAEPEIESAEPEDKKEETEKAVKKAERPAVTLERLMKKYKIQEVIKSRQIVLVQAVKAERGNKGAAMTTYVSLAGRYSVLMPNAGTGGGISRKITNVTDRKRLKLMIKELGLPEGMALIVRTAGMDRSKTEIKRDFKYLMELWSEIRSATLEAAAPALVYKEADLINRSIRDIYTSEIAEVIVEGEDSYKQAKNMMKKVVPSHAKKVVLYQSDRIPLFFKHTIERQISDIFQSVVQLKSGGYLVIHPTEALVAIDVNSGKATRERHIDSTAYNTNLEAAEEVARQVKLRDLAGLVVIDFIDMSDNRQNAAVERRMRDCMANDRARIQIGRISSFGLMEMSRQRLRPSILERSSLPCDHCDGTGHVRSASSIALQVLRVIAEEAATDKHKKLKLFIPESVGFYLLNEKRQQLTDIEKLYTVTVELAVDNAYHNGFCLKNDQDDVLVSTREEDTAKDCKPANKRHDGKDNRQKGQNRRSGQNNQRRNRQDKDSAQKNAGAAVEKDTNNSTAAEGNADPATEGTEEKAATSETRPRQRRGRNRTQGRNNPRNNRPQNSGRDTSQQSADTNNSKDSASPKERQPDTPRAKNTDKPAADKEEGEPAKAASKRKGWWQRLIEP